MPQRSNAKCASDAPYRACARRAGLVSLCLLGCAHQDATVGRIHPADTANSPEPEISVFESEFADNPGTWTIDALLTDASVRFGDPEPEARDGKLVRLKFPGDPERSSSDAVGPAYVTQIATERQFSFGTLRTRLAFGTCAPGEDVVQSVLGYFSDGSDLDRDGLTDELEIDLQTTCGTPGFLYLTVFTDYERTPTGEQFQKRSHIVDFSTGAEYDTVAEDSDEFIPSGTRAELKREDLVAPGSFHVLGFEWQPDSIRFFLSEPAGELTLWMLDDPARIPQHALQLMYNLWHPDSHWFPSTGKAGYPADDVVMRVDWIRFESVAAE